MPTLQRFAWLVVTCFLFPYVCWAQDEMDKLMDGGSKPEPTYAFATFKATRIINGHSIELVPHKHLLFMISHRFNRLDQGFYDIFGLDQATIRFGFDYGITKWLQVGAGRSTFEKTYDGYLKARLLRQSKGSRKMPISLGVQAGTFVNTLKPQDETRDVKFASRLSYSTQILIARKFNEWFSLQVTPTMIHRNLVPRKIDPNDVFALGFGGRVKISNRIAINGEYYHLLTAQTRNDFYSSASIGVDIDTGGHIFQLHLTNSRPMIENGFVAQTTGNISDGGIYFGFNVTRTFSFDRSKGK